jgi:hypothetical protein
MALPHTGVRLRVHLSVTSTGRGSADVNTQPHLLLRVLDRVYTAVAWQRVVKIRYNIILHLRLLLRSHLLLLGFFFLWRYSPTLGLGLPP